MTYGKLIISLHESIEASGIAYRNYISGGKTFRFAEELKRYNDKITLLIKENSQLLSPPLQEHAAGLLHHYNVWTEKWIQLAEAMNPGPDDIFVFANEVTFPKQAAIRIEEEYWIIKAVLNPPD